MSAHTNQCFNQDLWWWHHFLYIYTQAPDLSSFLVQLRQLLLMFDSHLRHFLLQSVTATWVSAQAVTKEGDTSGQVTGQGVQATAAGLLCSFKYVVCMKRGSCCLLTCPPLPRHCQSCNPKGNIATCMVTSRPQTPSSVQTIRQLSHLASCPLCTSYFSAWYLSDRTACRSDFSNRRWSETQAETGHSLQYHYYLFYLVLRQSTGSVSEVERFLLVLKFTLFEVLGILLLPLSCTDYRQ